MKGEAYSPVSRRPLVVCRRIRSATWATSTWRWWSCTAAVRRTSMTIGVAIFVAATTARGTIAILAVTSAWCAVTVLSWWWSTSTWRATSAPVTLAVVVVAWWRTAAVVVATRAVATRWATAIPVVVAAWRSWWVAATTRGRRRARAVTRWTLGLFIGNAADSLSLELAAVEFVNSIAQVSTGFVLDETSAVAVAADLGVDDVKSRLAGEILQILKSCVSPGIKASIIFSP